MKLYIDGSEVPVIAKAVRRPKFHRPKGREVMGRTWESMTAKLDGNPVTFYYDSTQGMRAYFQAKNSWYSIPIFGGFERIGYKSNLRTTGHAVVCASILTRGAACDCHSKPYAEPQRTL